MATVNQVNVGLSGASGTGSFAGTTSPTFITPLLGTPTSGVLTNCTGTGGVRSFQILTTGTGATYTKPANVTSILVEAFGGGGGGGGAAISTAGYAAGGGGGAGGYCRKFFAAAASTYTYTIGAAGAGGSAGANDGVAGGNTAFDTMAANGGGIGKGCALFTVIGTLGGTGGAGGTSSGGDLIYLGGPATHGFGAATGGTSAVSGSGGNSALCGGAPAQLGASGLSTAGVSPPANSGAGGSGGVGTNSGSAAAGGAGSAGVIIVWELS